MCQKVRLKPEKSIKLYYRLEKEIDECMKDAIIISTENLSFANHARIKLLSEATAKYRVTIILYVRDQPSILLSAYLQWIRMLKIPVYEQLIDFIENHASSFDYRSILSKYEQAFGVDNIIVRHYRKDLLKSGDVVVDFASLCNIELSSECHVSTNRSLSLQVLPLALLINKLDIPKTQKQSLMSSLGELSDTLPFQSAKPMIDVKMHDWILNRFSESNEYICSTYGINLNAS